MEYSSNLAENCTTFPSTAISTQLRKQTSAVEAAASSRKESTTASEKISTLPATLENIAQPSFSPRREDIVLSPICLKKKLPSLAGRDSAIVDIQSVLLPRLTVTEDVIPDKSTDSSSHHAFLHNDAHSAASSVRGVAPSVAPTLTTGLQERPTPRDSSSSATSKKKSMKGAALAVAAVSHIRDYRRSSATLHTDLLRAFVPDVLINYLENASKPLESQAFFVKAACMCADISGFTALSEKHCKQGTAGLDTLVQIINSYYSNLVNIVYSFGGDIIKIAGDALYCVFMPDEHDLRGAALCAALCSMQLREVAADGLTLHVGLSCGELCFGILGGIDNYWECLMSGAPIGLVADALDEAKKQEVVVSAETLAIIGDCCRGTPLPSRNVLLSSMEPPRREKRGSVRVANMIANKGLPVELEPVEGLFDDRSPNSTSPNTPSLAAVSPAANALAAAAAAAATRQGGESGGRPIRPSVSAAWASSTAKARGRGGLEARQSGKGPRRSEIALGAAGKMRADASSRVLPLLEGFVPGPVTDMLAAGIFMYMAEMRTVTTLFVKLDSYSPEKNENLLSLQIHLTTVQKILAEHEGFLRQFLVDDKGCVLIACWGVPGRSYPDNGNRCLAAAVEMHASLQAKEMKTSMGVTTGHALCGRVGGKIRSEYAMVGDVINLAARLMGKAKGRILVDEVTHNLVCSNESAIVLFKQLDPMMLKGKEKPTTAYVCLAQQGSDMWDTHKQFRMIGRTQLQNAVNALLDTIGKPTDDKIPAPRVVVIEGAQGTGKTMVADRVKKSASQFFRRKVYMYSMAQTLCNVPYSGAKAMLWTIFGLDHVGDDALGVKIALLKIQARLNYQHDDDGNAVSQAFFDEKETSFWKQIVRAVYGSAEATTTAVAIDVLKAVLGVDVGAETEGQILYTRRSSMRGRLPLHAVLSVITELATHALGIEPAVFILDNVHFMDEMSWKLLIQLLHCPLRLLLVMTATPVEEDIRKRKKLTRAKKKSQAADLSASKTQPSEHVIWHEHRETHLHMQQYIRATQLPITSKFTLPPFSKQELRQLLQHTLLPKDKAMITEELVDTVYSLSGGNPYWCVEVVRFIKENSVSTFMSRITVEQGAGGQGKADGDSKARSDGGTASAEEAMMGRIGILVVCRFERLLVEEQSVVRYASVAGVEFSMSLLRSVLPRNIRPQLELIIQALVTARFVVHSRHTYYKFRNKMVHMVLYNLTPASSRKRMHRAVADYYKQNHANEPLYLPVITHHLLQAKVNVPQAVEYLCSTASHALVAFCFGDCMESLEKAVELATLATELHEVLVILHYVATIFSLRHAVGKRNNYQGATGSGARLVEDTQHSQTPSGRSILSSGSQGSERWVLDRSFRGSNAGEAGSVTFLQHEDSGERIERLSSSARDAHAKLCPSGESCPVLKGDFNSGRSQKVNDEASDPTDANLLSLAEGSTAINMVPEGADYPASNTTLGESLNNWTLAEKRDLAAWAGGGEGCTGGIADDGGRRRQWSETSNALSAEGEPGLEVERLERQSGAPKWGAAELLSTRLARYMLPDGPIPESPNRDEVNYSTVLHRLPPEIGQGDADPFQGSDEEEGNTTRWIEGGRQKYKPDETRANALRSKVGSAAMLLSERRASQKLNRSLSSASKYSKHSGEVMVSNIRRSVSTNLERAGRLAHKMRLSSPESSRRSTHEGSSVIHGVGTTKPSTDVGVVGTVLLAPLAPPHQPHENDISLSDSRSTGLRKTESVVLLLWRRGLGVVKKPPRARRHDAREGGSSSVCVVS